jgi:ABC-type nitrate/sulfonate/bicarbonate transport system permease component
MPVVQVLFWIVVIGLCVWAVNKWVPLPDTYMRIFNAIAIVATIIWIVLIVADWLGISAGIGYVPHLHH